MTDTWWVKQGHLDPDQKKVFTLPITTDHLVKGPPGSGKTNVLLLRGKQLIGSNIPDIVVVVHTRTLQEFIRSGAPKYGISAAKIVTFRKFGTELLYSVGAGVTLPADFEKSREVLVDALQAQIAAKRIQQEYACVLVDEAQDFLPGEIDVMRALGKRFFGVADSRQKIYKGQDSIKQLESTINTVTLPFHYRNGQQICVVADGLAKVPTTPTLLETSKYPEHKLPSNVVALRFPSLDEQCDELLAQLDIQLKAYPDDFFGVACPRSEDLDVVIDRLRNSVFAGEIVVQTSDEGYEAFDQQRHICVCRLHSAKGLEFRAFHILAAEGLKKFAMQRELSFMGATRAKTSLSIYHSDDLPSYLEGALSKLKPNAPVVGLDALLDDDEEDDN